MGSLRPFDTGVPDLHDPTAWTIWVCAIAANIYVRLRLSTRPEDNTSRACICSFCRSRGPRMVSDPQGYWRFGYDWSPMEYYRFGTRTCDFLICRGCSVFVAAVSETTMGARAVVNELLERLWALHLGSGVSRL